MIFFDGHVHVYDCFDLDTFFHAAFVNFSAAAEKICPGETCSFYLLLAEARGCDYFSKLKRMATAVKQTGGCSWTVEQTGEDSSLFVVHRDFPDMRLVLVAGRQLVTRENLEVLALITNFCPEDGQPLEQCVRGVLACGGIPVCPWGSGKWLGKRGRLLRLHLQTMEPSFFLADNGGRPFCWPTPGPLRRPSHRQRLLSGSDPLPLPGEESRVGSFGGMLQGSSPLAAPAAFLKKVLYSDSLVVKPYGSLSSVSGFVRRQSLLRMR